MGHPTLRNGLGQVLDIGTLIVYPKTIGTMKFKMTPGVIIDIIDVSKTESKLLVSTTESVRPVHLSNLSKVIVVDVASLDLPKIEMDTLKELLADINL